MNPGRIFIVGFMAGVVATTLYVAAVVLTHHYPQF